MRALIVFSFLMKLGPYLRTPEGKFLIDKLLDAVEDWAQSQSRRKLLWALGRVRLVIDVPDDDVATRGLAAAGNGPSNAEDVLRDLEELAGD